MLVATVNLHHTLNTSIYHCKKIIVILTIAMSSELQPTDMDSCIGTTILLLQY